MRIGFIRVLSSAFLLFVLASCTGPGGQTANPPATPTGLQAQAGDAQVVLNWTANSETDLTKYTIYQGTESGNLSKVGDVSAGTETYTASGLTNGTPYFFALEAENSAGKSSKTAEVSATPTAASTQPAAPSGLQATAGDAQVTLTWQANSESDLASYTVYQGTSSGNLSKVSDVPAGTETFTATGLTNGTPYFFAIDAKNTQGQSSSQSAEVSATPTAEPSVGCTPPAGTGTLSLTITAPAAITPNVAISGEGFSQTLSTTQDLSVESGLYQVKVKRVSEAASADELVGKAYGEIDASLQEVCVEPEKTTSVTVTYEEQPASGKLWAANDLGHRILGFSENDLATPNSDPASIRLDFGFDSLKGIAFDDMGNLWAARFNPEAIIVLTPDQLAASGTPTPALIIESSSLSAPWDVAFDSEGNLWVSDWQKHSLLMFAPDTLDELLLLGGEQTRAPDYTLVTTELFQPEGLAIDAAGNLWVGSSKTSGAPTEHKDRLMKFAADDLGTVTPDPALILTGESTMIGTSWPAFDEAGNLWFTTGKALGKIAASELSATDTVVVDFSQPGNFYSDTISLPQGLTFDATGDIWLSDFETTIRRYTPTENNTGVAWSTSSDLRYPQGLAFYPSPLGATLPLR